MLVENGGPVKTNAAVYNARAAMRIATAVTACVLASVAAARAQEAGAVVAGSAAVANLDSRSEWSFAGSAGYRFNRSFGLEIEATAVPTLKAAFPAEAVTIQSGFSYAPIAIFPAATYTNLNGRAVFFTTNVRVEIPTPMPRLTPFFVAGGGVATVRHTADLTSSIGILPPTPIVGGVPGIRTVTEPVSASSTDLALTIGGGVAIGLTSHVGLDVDLRLFRMLGGTDTNAGRFGVGARYRF